MLVKKWSRFAYLCSSSDRRSGRAGGRAAKKQADPESLEHTDDQEENDAISRFTGLFGQPDNDSGDEEDDNNELSYLEHGDISEDGDQDVEMHSFEHHEHYEDDEDEEEEDEEEEEDDEDDEDDDDDEEIKHDFEFSGHDGDMPSDMRRFFATMRGLGGTRDTMSDHSNRMKSILINLRNRSDPSMQLVALQGLAELLSVSTEDTLAGIFNSEPYVKELVHILKESENMLGDDGMDDATLAAIMASGGDFGTGNPEMMLLACRCISNLIEAMPSALGTVVYSGAVPVLCQKLKEIQYIDLAEQALSVSACYACLHIVISRELIQRLL